MSHFDDNFLESLDNPFADPSVAQATNNVASSANSADYNLFDGNLGNMSPATGPAVMHATQQEPPPYTKSAQQIQNDGIRDLQELKKRQEELDQRAAELDRREREISASGTNVRKNNWPPLPDGFYITPCFYMDINQDIKVEFQQIVRRLYHLWIVHGSLLILNVFGTFCMMIDGSPFTSFVVALVYLILFTPLSFLCWYRPVYKAFRSDSSFQFMVFFFVFFFQLIMTTFMAVGAGGSGTCGIIQAIQFLRADTAGEKVVGIIVLIIALAFAALAALQLFLLATMLRIYRGTDASMSKASAEFTSDILGNKFVREAATDAAAATIRSQLNQEQQNNRG